MRLLRGTDAAAVPNEPVVGVFPTGVGEKGRQVFFYGQGVFALAQAQTIGQAQDMGVDGKGGDVEAFHADDVGCFAANAGE